MPVTEFFDLANSFHQEHVEIMSAFLVPEDISVTHGEPGFDRRTYLVSPESAAHQHCESIYIAGDNAVKKRWLKVLPSISGVKRAVLHTTAISESLMQAVCVHRGIERLNFDSTRLESFEMISQLNQLTHLAIGSSPRIGSLSALSDLNRLKSLSIQGNFPKLDQLGEISELALLQGFSLSGQDYKVLRVNSLEPISELANLRFVSLAAVQISAGGLKSLCDLPALEFLYLDPFHMHVWELSDIAALNEAFPDLRGSLIRRVATEPDIAKKLKIG